MISSSVKRANPSQDYPCDGSGLPASKKSKEEQTQTSCALSTLPDDGKSLKVALTDSSPEQLHADSAVDLKSRKITESNQATDVAKPLAVELVHTFSHDQLIADALFSPDGARVITASSDGSAYICRKADDCWVPEGFICHNKEVSCAEFSQDSTLVITGSRSGRARIHQLINGQWEEKLSAKCGSPVVRTHFSPDSAHAAVEGRDFIVIFGLVEGEWRSEIVIPFSHEFYSVGFSPDSCSLVFGCGDRTCRVYGFVDDVWQEQANIAHPYAVHKAVLSFDGTCLATVSENTVRFFRFSKGQWQESATLEHDRRVSEVRFSRDGQHVLTVSDFHLVKVFSFVRGKWRLKTTIKHSDGVSSARFSPDSTHLLTSSADDTARIYGLGERRWQEEAVFTYYSSVGTSRFSPDSSRFVAFSQNGYAQVYEQIDGQWQERAKLDHDTKVWGARFSPDGDHLLTVCDSACTLNIWGLESKKPGQIA